MYCPFCQRQETKVVDSRLSPDGGKIRRRRQCIGCHQRFTTYETLERVLPRVVKRDGGRVGFDVEKLRSGMLRALEKRPVAMEQVDGAVERILQRLYSSIDREVSTEALGEWVMHELRGLDQVAYVRFASVYRCFQDVSAFREEIDRLEKATRSND